MVVGQGTAGKGHGGRITEKIHPYHITMMEIWTGYGICTMVRMRTGEDIGIMMMRTGRDDGIDKVGRGLTSGKAILTSVGNIKWTTISLRPNT